MKSLSIRTATWLSVLAASVFLAHTSTGQGINLLRPPNGGQMLSYTSQFNNTTYAAANLTDGLRGVPSALWSSAVNPGPQGFVYAFSNNLPATVTQATIYNYGEGGLYYSRAFEIWGSANAGASYSLMTSGTLAAVTTAQNFNLGTTTVNRIQLLIKSGLRTDYWELSEFEVYGSFITDSIAPVPGTPVAPAATNGSPIIVTYSGASDAGGSGLARVELWYKKGVAGTWLNSGLIQTGASGVFNFTGMTGSDTYFFGLVAVDGAGNRSAVVTGAGATSTVFTQPVLPPNPLNLVWPANGGQLLSYTSQFSTVYAATNLTDGRKAVAAGLWSSALNPGVQGFVYAFSNGLPATLTQATIYNYGEGGLYYSRAFEIWGSANSGVTYSVMATGTLAAVTNAQTFSLGSATANRVKLLIKSGLRTDYWELSEFEVYGTLTVVAPDTIPPVPGTASSPAVTNASPIVVTYTGASDTGGSGLASIELWVKAGATGTWVNSGLTQTGAAGAYSYTVSGSSNTYYFGLVAVDGAGNRSAAVTGNGQTATLFAPPVPDTIPPVPGTASSPAFTNATPIVVTYTGASDAGGSGLSGVELWYKAGTNGTWTDSGLQQPGASGSFNFISVTGSNTYYFGLVATDGAGNQSPAVTGNGATATLYVPAFAPPAPTNALAEFWLRSGTITNTMPDGRLVVMWGFARDSADGAGDGTITVPGPALNVAANGSLVIHLQNMLPEPVSIGIPGQYGYQILDPVFQSGGAYDGRVRSFTHEAAPLGGKATYTWNNVQPGTFLYHSVSHPSVQVQMGLYGAFTAVLPGPAVYSGVPFNTSATLLFSEIDPYVHDAAAGATFGPGPQFYAADFTNAAAFIASITGSGNAVAAFIAAQLSGDPNNLVSDLNAIIGGPSIYDATLFPDAILSPATLQLLRQVSPPSQDYPISGIPFNGDLVRMNRLLLQDGLTAGNIAIPLVHTMTSTIRSYAQYFMINGQSYTNGQAAIYAGAAGSSNLLRMLNAGTDMHMPTLNNAGDMLLQGEDGQQSPYVRKSAVVFLPALKTVDAIWTATAASTNAIYDRRLGLVNGTNGPGGMLAFLAVSSSGVVGSAPSILVPPANAIAFVGQSATFSVVASHVGTPTYQWQLGGVNIGGATAATYTIPAVAATNLGSYTVVVKDGALSTTSAVALLTVVTAPAPTTVADGALATFSVTNLGPAVLTYQWMKDGVAVVGATNATYSFNANYATDNGQYYQVTVYGPGGTAVSSPVALTVTPAAPAIVTQPASQTVPDFGIASFTVGATGSGLTYEWQRSPTLTGNNFADIVGASGSNYSFAVSYAANNSNRFQVIVSRAGLASVTSSVAVLTVTPVGPQILTQPTNTTVNYGQPTALSVVARATGTLGYQWQKLSGLVWTNVTGSGITGATAATLAFDATATANAANSGSYRVIVTSTGLGAGSVTSATAIFTVAPPAAPVIVAQPASLTTTAGVAQVTFTVGAIGYPTPTYQWQRFNGTTWANLANSAGANAVFNGVTTPTLTVASGSAVAITVAHAGTYRVVVSNLVGSINATGTLTVIQTFAGARVTDIPLAGGTATPYPATTATVPSLTGAEIRHVSVNLTLSSDMPWDVTAMLVSPGSTNSARKAVFMSGLGPEPTEAFVPTAPETGYVNQYQVTNCVLTFDDSAPAPVNYLFWLASGTYQPSIHPNKQPLPAMPAPAPGLTSPTNAYPMTFGAFNALTAAGGQWRLFVNDDQAGFILGTSALAGSDGTISNWSLTLTAGPIGGPLPPALPLAAPQPATPLTPGDVPPGALINTFTPTYTWSTVPGATQYQIMLRTVINGTFSLLPVLPAAQVVNPGGLTASYTQPTPFAPGTYVWWVIAANAAGNSQIANNGLAFATPNAGSISPVQPISPSGATTATPTYTFNLTAMAQQYQIHVTSVATGVSTDIGPVQTVNLAGGTIPLTGTYGIAQPTPLAPGNYTWVLQTELGGGWAWSYPMSFSVP